MTNEKLSSDAEEPEILSSFVEQLTEIDNMEAVKVTITQAAVDTVLLRKILEGAILASGQPMSIPRLLELFDEEVAPTKDEIQAALEDIRSNTQDRGFELKEVASGWRFQVRENLAPWVNRLWDEKPQKYSRALLETLALVAYRQPITRGDIEEIRGVAVSSHIIKTLMEREWVKVVGHRDVPGRPSLYATTRQFLDYFNLKSLDELPSLSEIRDLDDLSPMLNLGDYEGIGEKDVDPLISDQLTSSHSDQPLLANDNLASSNNDTYTDDGFVDGEAAFEYIGKTSPLLLTEPSDDRPSNLAHQRRADEEDNDEEDSTA